MIDEAIGMLDALDARTEDLEDDELGDDASEESGLPLDTTINLGRAA